MYALKYICPLLCPYADSRDQPTNDPKEVTILFGWPIYQQLDVTDGDSILRLHISDVGHILQSAELEREKVPVAFALS